MRTIGPFIIVSLFLSLIAGTEAADPNVRTFIAAVDLQDRGPMRARSLSAPTRLDTGDATPPESFGFGRPATPEEIALWDIDVMADGTGLPPGSGSVAEGAEIYASKCAHCHGKTGTEGPEIGLVGRLPDDAFPYAEDPETRRRIGSYWQFAPTLFDYTRRSMPFDIPGSLSADEVYAVTAFLLHANELIAKNAVMNARTLPQVEMPARDRFVPDDRLNYQIVH